MKVSIREFRANLSKLLEEKLVEITRNGKTIGVYAKLAEPTKADEDRLARSGIHKATLEEKSVHNPEPYPIEQPIGQDVKAESVHNNNEMCTQSEPETDNEEKSVHNSDKPKKNVYTKGNKKPKNKKFVGFGNYGCGCPKGDTVVCAKHNRM